MKNAFSFSYETEREKLQGGEQGTKGGSMGSVGPGEEGDTERRSLSFNIMFSWNCKDSLQGLRMLNRRPVLRKNIHWTLMPISPVFALPLTLFPHCLLFSSLFFYQLVVDVFYEWFDFNYNIFVTLYYRLTLVLSCRMNFETFPMDMQRCRTVVESCEYLIVYYYLHTYLILIVHHICRSTTSYSINSFYEVLITLRAKEMFWNGSRDRYTNLTGFYGMLSKLYFHN